MYLVGLHIYYKTIHGPYNVKTENVLWDINSKEFKHLPYNLDVALGVLIPFELLKESVGCQKAKQEPTLQLLLWTCSQLYEALALIKKKKCTWNFRAVVWSEPKFIEFSKQTSEIVCP